MRPPFAATAGGLLAGLAAGTLLGGLVLGVGGRLAMTAIQVSDGFPSEWSWGGTWQVIIPGLTLGPAAGLAYSVLRPTLPGSAVARGAVFGVVHGAFWAAVYFLRPAGPVELSAAPRLGGALFAGLLLAFGVTLAGLEQRWRSRFDGHRITPTVVAGASVLAVLGFGFTLWVLITR